jgi:hypothetical protein
MKTLLICGSRNPIGQTAQAALAVLKGLAKSEASTEQVFLPTLKLERCRQCDDSGWGLCRKEGRCVIDDDLSESLRAFTDRLRRICKHEAGRASIRGKPMIGVCAADGSGGGSLACCASLEKVMTTCGFDVVDMIPVRRQTLQAKLQALEHAGQWLAAGPRSD